MNQLHLSIQQVAESSGKEETEQECEKTTYDDTPKETEASDDFVMREYCRYYRHGARI